MKRLTLKQGRYLVALARSSIEGFFDDRTFIEPEPSQVPGKALVEERACFVTLLKRYDHSLRGCIGSLEPHLPLYQDVIRNAVGAAFDDTRFYPLKKEELPQIMIEISVLTIPEPLNVSSPADLLKKLVRGRHGLIISKGYNRATFLPSVWKTLRDKEDFLSSLCMKAGLGPSEWKDTDNVRFHIYEAEEFSE